MACTKSKRKRYRPRKGLIQAAKVLGVSYSHLRRAVIGERISQNLLRRYDALVATDPQPTTKGKS